MVETERTRVRALYKFRANKKAKKLQRRGWIIEEVKPRPGLLGRKQGWEVIARKG